MSDIELKARELLARMEKAKRNERGHWCDARAGVDAACDALPKIIRALAPQWQPIESAPKDMTNFLAGEFYFDDGACIYKEFSTAYRYQNGQVRCYDGNVKPTHWQPLPAPPEVEG